MRETGACGHGGGTVAPVWRGLPSPVVVTDLYEVSMALVYLREGLTGQATFSLTVRDLPPERGFLVAAGLADALLFLEEPCAAANVVE